MALKLGMRWFLALCFLIASAESPHAFSAEHHGNTLTHQGDHRYRPSRHPDRLIIVPGADAAHSVSINWRTSASVRQTVVQWTQALDTPGLHLAAKTALGSSQLLKTAMAQVVIIPYDSRDCSPRRCMHIGCEAMEHGVSGSSFEPRRRNSNRSHFYTLVTLKTLFDRTFLG
jgi:hypothetical protein